MKKRALVLWLLFLGGCAGFSRDCASCKAESFGTDWIVVQTDMDGRAYRCWELHNTSVTSDEHTVYWMGDHGLVHLEAAFDAVQVTADDWDGGFAELGLTEATCTAIQRMRLDPVSRQFAVPTVAP